MKGTPYLFPEYTRLEPPQAGIRRLPDTGKPFGLSSGAIARAIFSLFNLVAAISFLFLTLTPMSANASYPGSYRAERWTLGIDASQFSSTSNYDDSGNTLALPGSDNSFTHTEITTKIRYDLNFVTSLFLNVGAGNSKSVSAANTRNRWSGTDVVLGMETKLVAGYFDLVPDLRLSLPLNRIDPYGDEVMTGEGALVGQVGIYLARNARYFHSYLYAGSAFRDEGRSWLLPWKAHASANFGFLTLGAEAEGFFTTLQDESTKDPSVRLAAVTKVNAGSFMYYSADPALTIGRAFLGFNLGSQTEIVLAYGTTLSGRRAAKGNELIARLEFGFGGQNPPPKASEVIETLEDESASFGAQPSGVGTPVENANSASGPSPEMIEATKESPKKTISDSNDATVSDPASFKPDRPQDDPVFQPKKKQMKAPRSSKPSPPPQTESPYSDDSPPSDEASNKTPRDSAEGQTPSAGKNANGSKFKKSRLRKVK